MNIGEYSFGSLVIGSTEYRTDVVVYPDGKVDAGWRRDAGHRMSFRDIARLVEAKPKVIVVGTGASGMMKPEDSIEKMLAQNGIEYRCAPTAEAVRLFNELSSQGDIGAVFHLTC